MILFATDPVVGSPHLALRIISYPSDKQSRSLHEQTLQGPAVKVLFAAEDMKEEFDQEPSLRPILLDLPKRLKSQ